MAVGVVNSSVRFVEINFPGSQNEIWYRMDGYRWNPNVYYGGPIRDVAVDINTVRKTFLGEIVK